MPDDYSYGDKIKASFEPKIMATLRICMLALIGRTFTWEWMGTSGDDEPYPGQSRWSIDRKHDSEIPDDCKGLWSPLEDLEIVE